VVPSFGRPDSLRTCLDALAVQSRAAEEVVVVTRVGDEPTRALVSAGHAGLGEALHEEAVEVPGQVMALIAGSRAAAGDLVAITDDDAAPRADWLERLEAWFEDDAVLGVGGRDVICGGTEAPNAIEVGRVRWNGKVIGNHHLGCGLPREVDVLKGANMAFRREAVLDPGFDLRLRGEGAQVHNDLKLCLTLRRGGSRLIYDPAVLVDHFPAVRPAGDHRGAFEARQQLDATHNETLALLEFLSGPRRVAFVVWALAIGKRPAPGAAHAGLAVLRGEGIGEAGRRLWATLRGRLAGWRTFRRQAHPSGSA